MYDELQFVVIVPRKKPLRLGTADQVLIELEAGQGQSGDELKFVVLPRQLLRNSAIEETT